MKNCQINKETAKRQNCLRVKQNQKKICQEDAKWPKLQKTQNDQRKGQKLQK